MTYPLTKRKGALYHTKFTVADYEVRASRVGACLIYPGKGVVARTVYILRHGPLVQKQYVCHTCDNPHCIEDSHHFIGTSQDNIRDAVEKRRHSSLRKGGVRFSGPHTEATRELIGAAARKMWAKRVTFTSKCRELILRGLGDDEIWDLLKNDVGDKNIKKQDLRGIRWRMRNPR